MKSPCEQIYQPREGVDNRRAFIGYLECLAGYVRPHGGTVEGGAERDESKADRAALARLRRTLGKSPNRAVEAYQYVACWTDGVKDEWQVQCYYLVASLFAMYPSQSWHPPKIEGSGWVLNLGDSFRRLDEAMRERSQTDERSPSLERRFTSLLVSRREDLPERLRHAVSLLRSYDIPIDWFQLLNDLGWWEQRERASSSRDRFISTQRQWANSFWRVAPAVGDHPAAGTFDDQDNSDND
jgi:CRISPR system Cascade subunit CasB